NASWRQGERRQNSRSSSPTPLALMAIELIRVGRLPRGPGAWRPGPRIFVLKGIFTAGERRLLAIFAVYRCSACLGKCFLNALRRLPFGDFVLIPVADHRVQAEVQGNFLGRQPPPATAAVGIRPNVWIEYAEFE